MPEEDIDRHQSQSQRQNKARHQGHRRGRGGKPRADGLTSTAGPAPVLPSAETSQSQRNAALSQAQDVSGRRTGESRQASERGRAGRLRGPRHFRRTAHELPGVSPHATFGSHLTVANTTVNERPTTSAAGLCPDAPEFVPGQPLGATSVAIPHSNHVNMKGSLRPSRKLPKSTAEDLNARIHEDIKNFNYECAICTDEVTRYSHVWSCSLCWTVVHLKCVRRWYENQRKHRDLQPNEPQRIISWRCPGCNSRLSDDPGSYHCWCGKDVNPQPAPSSLPPHSCGQTCSKPRSTCPHPCSLQCHAGPCPPCGLMGSKQSCYCGKNESHKLCRETDYEHGWSCQETCGDLLPCGEHSCPKPCHAGLCGECDAKVETKCYCGRLKKTLPCSEREDPQQSFDFRTMSWFEGVFSCEQACDRKFDCNIHRCLETCHPQEEQAAHCPRSSDSVSHCPCGKTPLTELAEHPRVSCEDPIPHCDKPCGKKLPCGHSCPLKCHTGDCGFCNEIVDITCRCGRTSSRTVCHQGQLERPMCMRVCQANLSCGRHKCGEHCCPGEKKALERQAAKRKHKLSGGSSSIEAEHICIKTCGRPLKCGFHDCQQMCHRGPCDSCPEAIFTEISCDCGRTVLQPPQPCGSRSPECRFNCLRQPSCGHPAVEHSCHSGNVPCPKCPFLVEKMCACGKEKLHSQPCHLQEPHCGTICGKTLRCGLHGCRKLCHRPGECEDVSSPGTHCEQLCGKTKIFCDHPCQRPCHGQTLCNESVACTSKAVIACPCGLRRQEVKCLASSSNPTPSRPDVKCDDECLRQERNRRLAAALNIDPTSHQNDHIPYSDVTLRLFRDNTTWAEAQEREFRVFAKSADEVRLRYKPMSKTNRQFLHCLAEDYGLESKSEDAEPLRHVVVFKGSRFVSAPGKTLAQCVRIRATQEAETAARAAASRAPSPPGLPAPTVQPFNSFLLSSPCFGLTVEDVESGLRSVFATQPSVHFETIFLPSEEVLLKAKTSYSAFLSPAALEQVLMTMKPRVAKGIEDAAIAGGVVLCRVESDAEITRRDGNTRTDASGWSAVAGRAVVNPDPLPTDQPRAGGRRLLGLRKKKVDREASWTTQLDGDVEC